MNRGSITAQRGRDFLLKISNGASPTTYVTVTGFRSNDITINGNPVDITNKASGGWQELLPDAGVESIDMTASGLYDSADAGGLTTCFLAALNRTFIEAEIVSGAGDRFLGTWAVPTFKRAGTHNDAETFDMTLKSHGPVVYSKT